MSRRTVLGADAVTGSSKTTDRLTREVCGVALIVLALLMAAVFYAPAGWTAMVGRAVRLVGFGLVGTMAWLMPVGIMMSALDVLITDHPRRALTRLLGWLTIVVAWAAAVSVLVEPAQALLSRLAPNKTNGFGLIHALWQSGLNPNLQGRPTVWSGGALGGLFGLGLSRVLGWVGALLVIALHTLAVVVLFYRFSLMRAARTVRSVFSQSATRVKGVPARAGRSISDRLETFDEATYAGEHTRDERQVDDARREGGAFFQWLDRHEVPVLDADRYVLGERAPVDHELLSLPGVPRPNPPTRPLRPAPRDAATAVRRGASLHASTSPRVIPEGTLEDVAAEQGRAHWTRQVTKTNRRRSRATSSPFANPLAPSLDLLEVSENKEVDERIRLFVHEQAQKLEDVLKTFRIDARVVNYVTGPTITRYELQPAPGIKVSKIVSLSDDIALNLAAIGVRIEAPIPGKPYIGIEIPNQETSPVRLREVIESDEFIKAKGPLVAALGRDAGGRVILCNIEAMPHLLIAGATGSGKSVCLNTILISLLYRSGPDVLRMLLIDPKVVELKAYNGIPHLLQPVVTQPKKAYGVLNWAVMEMDRRYGVIADKNVREINAYNRLVRKEGHLEALLPHILIVIDELADLMYTTATEVEDAISRLMAKARAAGIHLIIATQRPSVDVITGVIKSNIPSRIAFAVSAMVDSRTILDSGGAEKLLGKGDMLYAPLTASKMIRGQCALVTDDEVERVLDAIKAQSDPDYVDAVGQAIDQAAESGDVLRRTNGEGEDELLLDALSIFVEAGHATVSLLQRRLAVGHPRAARLVDRLHTLGWVGPAEGSKPRKVLISQSDYNALIKERGEP